MTYALLLLIIGVGPMTLLWLARPDLIWRYKGSLLVIVILILLVSIPWEMLAIDQAWRVSSPTIPVAAIRAGSA